MQRISLSTIYAFQRVFRSFFFSAAYKFTAGRMDSSLRTGKPKGSGTVGGNVTSAATATRVAARRTAAVAGGTAKRTATAHGGEASPHVLLRFHDASAHL